MRLAGGNKRQTNKKSHPCPEEPTKESAVEFIESS